MSEMIERVAVALLAATCAHYGDKFPSEPDLTLTLILARAAMRAMREPTEEMLKAAYAIHTLDTFWDHSTNPPTLHTKLGVAGTDEDYRAMIDAALK